MASVRALRLVDVATPPALAKAVSSELLARLNMREIPILLMRQQSGAGGLPGWGFAFHRIALNQARWSSMRAVSSAPSGSRNQS